MKTVLNKQVITEIDPDIVINNNHYFPPNSTQKKFVKPSDIYPICEWKLNTTHFTLDVDYEENKDAVWYYPEA